MTRKGKHYLNMHKHAPASNFSKASILRSKMTPAEKHLWESLRNRKFHNFKFRRQHPLHFFIVDFYCHELKLIIEVDGEYHNDLDQLKKDKTREELLNFQGLNILRFTNHQVLFYHDEVLEQIKSFT